MLLLLMPEEVRRSFKAPPLSGKPSPGRPRSICARLALHLNTDACETHHELERLAAGVADAVEALGRRHDAEGPRADRIRLVTDAHFTLALEDKEAFLDI